MFSFRPWPILLALLLVCGCDRDDSQSNAGPVVTELGKGIIRGQVILSGVAPPRKMIPGTPNVMDETLVVSAAGGLKNVIVFLQDAPRTSFTLQSPAVLDQINCTFVPHVQAVQAGQTLRLKSSDQMPHNMNMQSIANPPRNYSFKGPSQGDSVLNSPEDPFPVKCDVHPWMKAWIGVFAHPWFAVTDADGNFEIDGVPPGQYTLAAWQEVLPQQEQKIVVSEQTPTEVKFTFQAP
jgi:hypothetical protein